MLENIITRGVWYWITILYCCHGNSIMGGCLCNRDVWDDESDGHCDYPELTMMVCFLFNRHNSLGGHSTAGRCKWCTYSVTAAI